MTIKNVLIIYYTPRHAIYRDCSKYLEELGITATGIEIQSKQGGDFSKLKGILENQNFRRIYVDSDLCVPQEYANMLEPYETNKRKKYEIVDFIDLINYLSSLKKKVEKMQRRQK